MAINQPVQFLWMSASDILHKTQSQREGFWRPGAYIILLPQAPAASFGEITGPLSALRLCWRTEAYASW